jgi:carboxypeptidase C (cathepsin A)
MLQNRVLAELNSIFERIKLLDMKKLVQGITMMLFFCSFNLKAQKQLDTVPKAQVFKSVQTSKINGQNLKFNTLAGTMELRDEKNKPIALHGFTAYFKEGGTQNRPIIFSFNGGPGSSSYWLHMGIMGPKRIVVNDPHYTPAAPYTLEDNTNSILDVADVVMMDPIGTGLSELIGKSKGKDFWGVDQDIRATSLFIMQFLKQYDRLQSPKYLLGESYGTFRNAGVMDYLLNRGYALNGVIMVSAVFDLRTLTFPPNDDLPYVVHFPTYAATAHYHNQLNSEMHAKDLETFIDEVREFTEDEYSTALFKGTRISIEEKKKIAQKLVDYAGCSIDFWMDANLKVKAGEFFNELLKHTGKTVGRLDSRYVGINENLMNQYAITDPQSDAISPAYTVGFLDYLYGNLGVSKDLNYKTTAGVDPEFKWDWSHKGTKGWGTQIAINTSIDMASAMSKDPNLKVLIMNGYYDLATVFYGVEHTVDHMNLAPEIQDNITMTYYESGHMMYIHPPSMVKFKIDLKSFIEATLN